MATTNQAAPALDDDVKHEIYDDFKELVNMTASELTKFLQTDESKAVGFKGADGKDDTAESVGHQSGERIVEILHKKKADLSDDDYAHMKKVIGYIRRHSAQRPHKDDLAHTNWTYSLKNWGHDPVKGDD